MFRRIDVMPPPDCEAQNSETMKIIATSTSTASVNGNSMMIVLAEPKPGIAPMMMPIVVAMRISHQYEKAWAKRSATNPRLGSIEMRPSDTDQGTNGKLERPHGK